MRIGFAHHLRIVDFNLRELEGKRGEGKCHAMILVGVDWGKACFAGLAIPIEGIVVLIVDDIAHLLQLGLEWSVIRMKAMAGNDWKIISTSGPGLKNF